MFAVEGWKLGDVVAQTNIKKKLKRKRDEVQETTGTKDEGKGKGPRINPFALGNAQPTKVSAGQQKKTAEAEASKTVKEDAVPAAPTISKRQQARNRAEKRAQRKLDNASNAEDHLPVEKTISKPIPRELPSAVPIPALTPLQQKMRAKLSGSQFRQINEKLYTTHSSEALSLFTEQPSLFHDVPIPLLPLALLVPNSSPLLFPLSSSFQSSLTDINDSITKVSAIKSNPGQQTQCKSLFLFSPPSVKTQITNHPSS